MSDVGGHPAEIESTDVYSEGLCMPPFKLYEAGIENSLAFSIMGANCRVPNLLLGDLRAIAGAAKIGADRLAALLDELDFDLGALAEEILRVRDGHRRLR
jgi:N-methylhydantoinase B/oxoprolinase/acetone carboxylase alpha subunit